MNTNKLCENSKIFLHPDWKRVLGYQWWIQYLWKLKTPLSHNEAIFQNIDENLMSLFKINLAKKYTCKLIVAQSEQRLFSVLSHALSNSFQCFGRNTRDIIIHCSQFTTPTATTTKRTTIICSWILCNYIGFGWSNTNAKCETSHMKKIRQICIEL